MKSAAIVALIAAIAIAGAAEPAKGHAVANAAPALPRLDDKNYREMGALIRPTSEEQRWRTVGWGNDLMAAVAEAKALQRPILLWSDQGNPLGMPDFAPSINTVVARREVYGDPEVQELCKRFVCTTAEVWTLATGKSPASDWFHAAGGPDVGGRAHGLYLFGPDGQNLGFHFLSRPRQPVVALLKEALAKWDALVVQKGYRPKPIPAPRPGSTWPEAAARSGLFLYVVARDLPRDKPDERRIWNHQFLDLSAKEAHDFLPQSGLSKGMVDESTVKRIARHCLVDFAKGNNTGYRGDGAIRSAWLSTEILATSGDLLTVRLHGEAVTEEASEGYDPGVAPPQLLIYGDHRIDVPGIYGFACTLHGKAIYDARAKRFAFFELVATGTRKGGRDKDDYQPAPMGVAFMLEGQYDVPADAAKPGRAKHP